ncbi:hypothetical protein ASPBRDRAFT_64001 [Aspergillus brasiliensis CBS 101740]|uniref:Uncharacterized protein n=1 Tax=Aspergillus brasiliensis (strain CBS 101740 / IMI 381727 / IBT 21946) TaxID=767769 RepID=A0A1L9UNF5_ASPBC|nr:hypothetical protein ASPBRDRAFT_64001 [Aspergillus brasiliensis CBS 101740]
MCLLDCKTPTFFIVLSPSDDDNSKATTTEQIKSLLTSNPKTPHYPSTPYPETHHLTESFIPIGHISLDSENPDNESIQLDDIPESHAYYWIKTFYVIQAVQSQGIGRAAMDQVGRDGRSRAVECEDVVVGYGA